MSLLYQIFADLVVIVHIAFVAFVLAGGLLAMKWPWTIRLHLPAAAWGALVEFSGWLCPLTSLENWLRRQAGQGSTQGDFVIQYLYPVLYPVDLTRGIQVVLGLIVLVMNGAVYGWLLVRGPMRRGSSCHESPGHERGSPPAES
jgi:hypothetical protein